MTHPKTPHTDPEETASQLRRLLQHNRPIAVELEKPNEEMCSFVVVTPGHFEGYRVRRYWVSATLIGCCETIPRSLLKGYEEQATQTDEETLRVFREWAGDAWSRAVHLMMSDAPYP